MAPTLAEMREKIPGLARACKACRHQYEDMCLVGVAIKSYDGQTAVGRLEQAGDHLSSIDARKADLPVGCIIAQ